MKVIPLTQHNTSQWDTFVEQHPDANMYHLLGWKDVFEPVFGYRPYYCMAMNSSEQPYGILPMFLMGDIFRRKYLISNPFSNFAGICSSEPLARTALMNRARELAVETDARYVELRQLENKLGTELPTKESFVTLMLRLPKDSDEIWNAISSRNRGKVRKGEKKGLRVDFGMKYLRQFYAIYAQNMRYLGTPVFPYEMFERVAEVFSDRVELLVLKLNDEPVSGMFLFKFRNVISEPWVASLRQYNRIYVNNHLYWQAIKYACEHGFEVFDFGRSTVDTGTYHFKLQWGAEPVPLYYQYCLHKAKEIPEVDAKNNKYQKAIELWKRLPLSITNLAGPKLVQYLPEL